VDLSLSLPFATDVSMDVLGTSSCDVEILLAEPIDPKVIVHVRLDARSVVGRPAMLASLSSRTTAQTGQTISLIIDPTWLHFFDPRTELAI
jgi:ABC-type sugar transport system ATPase subunit